MQLLQVFFDSILPKLGIGYLRPYPSLSGTFDAVLGYWIYQLQNMLQTKVDGRVSPLTGNDGKTAGKPWTIFALNELMVWNCKPIFENLHNDGRLRPSLRAALKP